MLRLTFNQKVGLGFVIILVLLAISAGSSLWNLRGIDISNTRVTESAVPVVQKANQVQIQLLKLANLSALGYNALDEKAIAPYRDNFEKGTVEFERLYEELERLTAYDASMKELVVTIKDNYKVYLDSVRAMFNAKLDSLVAKSKSNEQALELIERNGKASDALMDVAFYEAPYDTPEKDLETIEESAAIVNEVEGILSGITVLAEQLQRTTDPEPLSTAKDDFLFITNESLVFLERVKISFSPYDPGGYIDAIYDSIDALNNDINDDVSMVTYKQTQLEKVIEASTSLESANSAVSKSVTGLDNLLQTTDGQLKHLQGELENSLDFGFKSSIVILIVLVALASRNFISMKTAIRDKIIDLANLYKIGADLAAARHQDAALNEVLQAMSEKMAINKGSVYLFNQDDELEAKAFLPPMNVPGDSKAISFTKGEGIIGRAAEMKKTVYVPNTVNDKNYVAKENEKAKSLICVPLLDKDVLMGVMNFSGDVNEVTFADSDYEFVETVARSTVTTIKNIRMVEVIEEHNRNLEKKVEERTAALKQKNDDIANMLSNMHQGLFTITDNGLIHPEYAAYLETIFETKNIANRNFTDLLFSNTNLSADVVDSAITSVASIVGEDSMMFEFNSHLLSPELTLCFDDKPDKLLELDWDPIVDDTDTVVKLMVTVRDVTELKALQAEAEGQKQELMIIGEILAVDTSKFKEFIETSQKFINNCQQLIEETEHKDQDCLAALFRNIHTVKGNARTYGFKHITDTVHLVENTYDELRKTEELEWKPAELLEELETARQAVNRYHDIYSTNLSRGEDDSADGKLNQELADSLVSRIAALNGESISENVVDIVKDTYSALAGMGAKPIDGVIVDVIDSVKSLALELDKAEPEINIEDDGILLRNNVHGMLNDVFMHVLRNAIDHGIESKEERAEKGKPENGIISIKSNMEDGMIHLAISEDGRGIALSKIFEKAQEKGLYDANAPRPAAAEIANLIFDSGFSTAEQVTEVSGRGVGMDAVRQFLDAEGGSIEVVLHEGDENADFRSFTTLIKLPEKFALEEVGFAIAS